MELLKAQNKDDQILSGFCDRLQHTLPLAKKVASKIISAETEFPCGGRAENPSCAVTDVQVFTVCGSPLSTRPIGHFAARDHGWEVRVLRMGLIWYSETCGGNLTSEAARYGCSTNPDLI